MKRVSTPSLVFLFALSGFAACARGAFAEAHPDTAASHETSEASEDPPRADSTPPPAKADLMPTWLKAESPALRERLRHAQRVFLWDGSETIGPGDLFYATPDWTRRLLFAGWIDAPSEWSILADPWPGDSVEMAFNLAGGAEVGDGLYREMQGHSRAGDNRTPYFRGDAEYAVTPQLRLRMLADQNDVATYRSFGQRAARVSTPSDWESLAYFGENLPTRSVALGAVDYQQRSGRLGGAFARGWRWSLSPVTGEVHPWLMTLTRFAADWDENTGLYFDLAQWQTPSPIAYDEGEGLRSEVGLRLTGGGEGWAWRLLFGVQRRRFETASASRDSSRAAARGFLALDDESYPFTLATRQITTWDAWPSLEWRTDMKTSTRDGLLTGEGESVLRRKTGPHRPELGVQAFAAYRTRGMTVAHERLNLPPLPTEAGAVTPVSDIRPDRVGRGAAASTRYAYVRGPEMLSAQASFASEWGRPVFEASPVALPVFNDPDAALDASQTLRPGRYVGSAYVLHNANLAASAASTRLPLTRLALTAGARVFFGHEAESLEYEPAPFWAGAEGTVSWPTDLEGFASVQAVGPKVVRQWSQTSWRTPAHLEAQIALRQAFWKRHLGAQVQMLHAFGDEMLEHPAGNPLRFRVLFGLEGRW